MIRLLRDSLLSSLACLLPFVAAAASVDSAGAQTTSANPQRPTQRVEQVRSQKLVLRDAARLDAVLERELRSKRIDPLPTIDDATYLRRAYLSIVGRIPTLAETEGFLADQNPGKRAALCDLLLDSPGRTSHMSNYWFDLLRVKSRQRQLSGEPFAHFIREAVQKDLPFDQFAQQLITAEGAAHADGNGATGHLIRDNNMPHDSMANTVRVFLGTRLECAQCHNHPFDNWTQKQFFGMAAFFGGIRYRDLGQLGNYRGLRKQLADEPQRTRQAALRMVRRLSQGIHGSGSGIEKLPKDYQYDDAKPGQAVKAGTIFGSQVKLTYPKTSRSQSKRARARNRRASMAGIDSREALAEWMTSPKNPQFARVISNRMWARTFGAGLVEPRDNWKKDTRAVHPKLLDELEKLMVSLDFDLRQFERVLVHTKLFERACLEQDPTSGVAPAFAGPVLRRMSAEQVWDSLLTLVFDDLDDRLRDPDDRAKSVYAAYNQIKDADAQKILELAKGGARDMIREMAKERRSRAREQSQRDAKLRRRARPLMRELEAARRDGDQQKAKEIAARLEQMGVKIGQRAAKGAERDMLRASDIEQPARLGHLLRQFGQSDRETIEAQSDVATVPQVLTLMNGFLDSKVLNGESALRRDLGLASDGARRVRVAYLTMLNREPTDAELKEWRREIAVNGRKAIEDLVWVLCNSNEFRFVR
ncbi:MAG: DUF1549 domain-containing protein [Planctomycetota bacterium]